MSPMLTVNILPFSELKRITTLHALISYYYNATNRNVTLDNIHVLSQYPTQRPKLKTAL